MSSGRLKLGDHPEDVEKQPPDQLRDYVLDGIRQGLDLASILDGRHLPDRQGMEPITVQQRAAALDLLAAGREDAFTAAARTLIGQGDHTVALADHRAWLLRHPASTELAGLRRTALHRLMEQTQQLDPFRFLIYAELAGAEIGPVQ